MDGSHITHEISRDLEKNTITDLMLGGYSSEHGKGQTFLSSPNQHVTFLLVIASPVYSLMNLFFQSVKLSFPFPTAMPSLIK
jgi:hypothetical protein